MKKILSLDIKYSTIQVLYFGIYVSLMGYASVYLLAKGFSNSVIGIALAISSAIAILIEPVVAAFSDKNKHIELRKIVAGIVIAMAILSASILLLGEGTIVLLCVFVGIATLHSTLMPLLNSMAFVFERYGIEINYGLGRGLGSAAYAIVSLALGYLAEKFGVDIFPIIYLAMNILLIFVVYTFIVPANERKELSKEEIKEEEKQLSFVSFCKRYKKFVIFVLGLILVYFIHVIINNFFIQIITPIGGTESNMGIAVFIQAIVELPVMIFFNNIRKKFSYISLIRFAVIMFAVKHILTFIAPNIIVIYIAQTFQMLSYAILIPASVYYANQVIEKSNAIKGQSMVTIAITASGIIANLVGGFLLDIISVHNVLLIGVGISIIGALIVIFSIKNKN